MEPNYNYINEIAEDDLTFKEKLISIIKKEFPDECKIFSENILNKKYVLAAENVHKLKHKINMLGIDSGVKIARDFENNLLNNKTDLLFEFNEILNSIDNFLKTN